MMLGQMVVRLDDNTEPCVFCGGVTHLKDSRGSTNGAYYWREECERCLSNKVCENGIISFRRSGHPLSVAGSPDAAD